MGQGSSRSRSGGALFAAAVLVAMLVLVAPPASAALPDLPGEVVKTTGSTVEAVTTTPAAPTETSAAPEPASDPVVPTPESTSTASGAAAGLVNGTTESGDAGLPSTDRIEGGAEESVAAAGAGSEEAVPTSPTSTAGSPAAASRPGARHGDPTESGDEKRLDRLAESNPVGWFLTYVWPAVALERAEALPEVLVAGLEAINPLSRPEARGVVSGPDGPKAGAIPPPSARPGPPAASPAHFSLPVVSALSTPLKIALYLSMSILLAALAFTVWAQFSAATRPHRWGR